MFTIVCLARCTVRIYVIIMLCFVFFFVCTFETKGTRTKQVRAPHTLVVRGIWTYHSPP